MLRVMLGSQHGDAQLPSLHTLPYTSSLDLWLQYNNL